MGMFSIFSTAELRARGETTASIKAAIEVGAMFRIFKGWYGTDATPRDAVLAMRTGGRLGCVSVLALHGAWVPPDSGVHVVFPTSASGRRSAGRERGPSVTRHWCARSDGIGSASPVMSLEHAVHDALTCVPPHLLIAVLDSLLHKGLISRNRLVAVIAGGPLRVRHLIKHLEPRSESGIESVLRYLLAISGIDVDVQVTMRSRDRLDLAIGDWLAIEADGRETHAKEKAFTKDRERVVRLISQGRITLQFPYATIMFRSDEVVEAVREVIARFAPVA